MALNIQGYVTPEQSFEGLEKYGQLQRQREERKRLLQQQEQKNRESLTKFGLDLVGKSDDYLTNTIHNPVINQKLGQLLTKAAQLSSQQGMNEVTMTQTLMPEIVKLKNETENVKQLEKNRVLQKDFLKSNKAINIDKWNENYTKNAYLNQDGTLREMSSLNPLEDYGTKALAEGDVYNENAVEDFLDQYKGELSVKGKIKEVSPNKKIVASSASVKYPQYLQPIQDVNGYTTGFRPKGEIVTDANEQAFIKDALGLAKNEEVGLLDEGLLNSNPNLKGLVMQKTEKIASELGKELDKNELDLLNRAVAYKMVELHKDKGSIVKERTEQAAPITNIRVTTGERGGSGKKEPTINDVYKEIDDEMELSKSRGAQLKAVNLLSTEVQNAILNEARKATGEQDLGNDDIVLWKQGNNIYVHRAENGVPDMSNAGLIGALTRKGINIKSQPTAKTKEKVIIEETKKIKQETPAERMRKLAAGKK